jgi:hypothetical protein
MPLVFRNSTQYHILNRIRYRSTWPSISNVRLIIHVGYYVFTRITISKLLLPISDRRPGAGDGCMMWLSTLGPWVGPMICNKWKGSTPHVERFRECQHAAPSFHYYLKKELIFISNSQMWKEVTLYASELAGIEPTPPAPEEQCLPSFCQLG